MRSKVTDLTTPSAASALQPYRTSVMLVGYGGGYKYSVRHDISHTSQQFSCIDSIPISGTSPSCGHFRQKRSYVTFLLSPEPRSTDYLTRLSNHFLALGRRCGHPGQQHGRRFPAVSSSTARWIRRARVDACLAEVTQQTHSFRASGVRSFQAACVAASELRALRKSAGALCTGPGLVLLFAIGLRPGHKHFLAS